MCWNCNNKDKNLLKDKLFNKLKSLKTEDSCSCREIQQEQNEKCTDGSCQEDSCEVLDEHLAALVELLGNAKTALSQIQDMVEEIEENLEDIKEAIGQTEEDLENAEEIIDNLC